MKKKKPRPGAKGLAGWYASYADMVTVLMVFFILMFSMSVIDQELFERFMDSFNPNRQDISLMQGGEAGIPLVDLGGGEGILPDSPPPPPPAPPGEDDGGGYAGVEDGLDGDIVADMYNTFRTYMADIDPGGYWDGQIQLGEEETFLRITLPAQDGMLFNSGQASLLPPAIEALDTLGPLLAGFIAEGHAVVVEGHTDNIPMQSAVFPSNRHLSSARAATVVEHLVDAWDIPPLSIVPTGLGEYDPIATNDTVEGRAANRRVEIKVFYVGGTDGGAVGGWTIPMN